MPLDGLGSGGIQSCTLNVGGFGLGIACKKIKLLLNNGELYTLAIISLQGYPGIEIFFSLER
jgi:hypothetical protein